MIEKRFVVSREIIESDSLPDRCGRESLSLSLRAEYGAD